MKWEHDPMVSVAQQRGLVDVDGRTGRLVYWPTSTPSKRRRRGRLAIVEWRPGCQTGVKPDRVRVLDGPTVLSVSRERMGDEMGAAPLATADPQAQPLNREVEQDGR